MKRDFDLIHKLLMFFEAKSGPEHVEVPPIEGYDDLTIKYHLVLLHDAEFLRCEPVKSSTSNRVIYVLPFDLTCLLLKEHAQRIQQLRGGPTAA